MKKSKIVFFLFSVLSLSANIAFAAQVFVSAVGKDVSSEGAIEKAKLAAWKSYVSKLDGAKLDNIIAREPYLLESLNSIISDVSVIDTQCTQSGCEVRIKATISENIIDSKLRTQAVSNKVGSAKSGDDVALLLMARIADVQTTFDARVTKRAEAAATIKAEKGDVEGGTAASSATVGGSSQQKRDAIVWVAYPNINDLQSRIGEVLNNNHINTVAWEELVTNCGVSNDSKFSKDYATSATGELPPATRSEIFKKLKSCDVGRIVIVSFEVDSYRLDPNTGLTLASGNINIQFYDLSGRFAKSIASVNRVFSGRGEKQPDAARNALANASKEAADVVINQINLK